MASTLNATPWMETTDSFKDCVVLVSVGEGVDDAYSVSVAETTSRAFAMTLVAVD